MTPEPHWRCQTCKQPMTGKTGSVSVYNANAALGPVGGYPVARTPDEPPPDYGRRPHVVVLPDILPATMDSVRGARWLVMREPSIVSVPTTSRATRSVSPAPTG